MHALTLFAVPRPFEGLYDAIQRNAIGSWLEMDIEIMLLHEPDSNVPEVARELGLRSYEVATNSYGTPVVSSVFGTAFARAQMPPLCYVNADIVVMSGLEEAARACAEAFGQFLMIGQRIDLDMQGASLSFAGDWRGELRRMIGDNGTLHAPCGIDYFCTIGNVWGEIPPFALGRAAWDNWLVARALRLGVTVVDATADMTIVHQAHPVPAGIRDWPECVENYRLLHKLGDGGAGVAQAPWVFSCGKIEKRGS